MKFERTTFLVMTLIAGPSCLPVFADSAKAPALPASSPVQPASSAATRKADLDGDGLKEAVVYHEGKKILKVVVDKNHDGKADAVVYYRNGCRDYAEIDADSDGRVDTVVLYYFTGVPAMVSVDRNKDGKPDRWVYFKNGIIYKREWDRNFDGIPDYRILFSTLSDLRSDGRVWQQTFEKQYDNDYDGYFEKSVKGEKRSSAKRLSVAVGSVSEERV